MSGDALARTLVREAPWPVALLDAELRYVSASLPWRRLLQLGRTPLGGRAVSAVSPTLPPGLRSTLDAAAAGRVEPATDGDGAEAVRWRAVPQRGPGGALSHVLVFAERPEAPAPAPAVQAGGAPDASWLLPAVAHDLQAPLRRVERMGEELARRAASRLDPAGADLLARMTDTVCRMRGAVEAVLSWARLRANPAELAPVSLDATVAEALDDLDDRVRASGAEVDVGPLPAVRGEPALLRQLFQNLLGNALKYHQPGQPPRVRVRGEVLAAERSPTGGPAARITVQDEGIGIEPDHLAQVFRPFARAPSGRDRPGAGIGLATCEAIVGLHGGRIDVESRPGRGACFSVVLPA